MKIPTDLIKATMAGLAMTLAVSCDKEPLQKVSETCDDTCKEGVCTDPIIHQGKVDNDPYYCPPCGMG